MQPFPTRAYIDDQFAELVKDYLGKKANFFMLDKYLPRIVFCAGVFMASDTNHKKPCAGFIHNFNEIYCSSKEKELKIKEGMLMMGLRSTGSLSVSSASVLMRSSLAQLGAYLFCYFRTDCWSHRWYVSTRVIFIKIAYSRFWCQQMISPYLRLIIFYFSRYFYKSV